MSIPQRILIRYIKVITTTKEPTFIGRDGKKQWLNTLCHNTAPYIFFYKTCLLILSTNVINYLSNTHLVWSIVSTRFTFLYAFKMFPILPYLSLNMTEIRLLSCCLQTSETFTISVFPLGILLVKATCYPSPTSLSPLPTKPRLYILFLQHFEHDALYPSTIELIYSHYF